MIYLVGKISKIQISLKQIKEEISNVIIYNPVNETRLIFYSANEHV